MSLRVAICITTHNRRGDLARTLSALTTLTPPPDELIIVVDGCTDGTAEWLRETHPQVRLIVHDTPRGSIPSRNEMAAAASGEILLSLDDDSHPIEPGFIARLRELFASHPRLAVAAFPQRTDEFPETLTTQNFGPSQFVGSFVNSGAAIRRSTFLALGGYPNFFFHAYEEPDFALRCVAAGWEVRHITSLTIRHHFTAAGRDEVRTHQRHARNELWSVLLRCPAPQFVAVAAFRAVRQFGYAWKRGLTWVLREPAWWLAFLRGIPRCLAARQPLAWPRYLAWMRLLRSPIADEAEWTQHFGERAE